MRNLRGDIATESKGLNQANEEGKIEIKYSSMLILITGILYGIWIVFLCVAFYRIIWSSKVWFLLSAVILIASICLFFLLVGRLAYDRIEMSGGKIIVRTFLSKSKYIRLDNISRVIVTGRHRSVVYHFFREKKMIYTMDSSMENEEVLVAQLKRRKIPFNQSLFKY